MTNDEKLLDISASDDGESTLLWSKRKVLDSTDDTVFIQNNADDESIFQTPTRPRHKPKSTKFSLSEQADSLEKPIFFSENLTIQRIIGEGGVGRVYLAYDEAIGRRVAVKELLVSGQDRQLENSFIHEAKITGKLEHPGIIPVYQLGYREDGRAYYVMRYVKGETLEEQLHKCQRSSAELSFNKRMKLLDTLINACDTLAYAHSKGVIHRDLKPGNIISGKFGETIILDWGLAQALDDGDDDFFRNVQAHQADTYSDSDNIHGMGTPRYMAPEQLKGKAGKASDVYSLGVILFKLITGELPYKGSAQEIQARLLDDKPSPSPNSYIASMSPELGAICEKAMAKNPFDRFADAGELSHQLKAYRDGRMVNIYSYSKQELFQRFLAKNKFIVLMFGLLFATIVAGAIFSIHYAIQMEQARTKAEEALVSVTALGEQAQVQANIIASNINNSTGELFVSMKKTASQLATLPQNEQSKLLEKLHTQYPAFTSFTVEDSSAMIALGWKAVPHQFDAPMMITERGKVILVFLVPVPKKNKTIDYLVAKAAPEKVLPHLFPTDVVSSQAKDIWLMNEDGLIFYDKEEKYRGTNIFSDTLNNQSPSVVAFGRLSVSKSNGVGYYSFPDDGKTIFKIAAWQTVNFPDAKGWKIVVNYAYMIRYD